ncbi:hypothetical protein DPMN_070587 [Dreissena polymorpha]|uniref:Uncharacterized protein n=1 Tax=Dreissena polymorpha TaxID=45954 RepID=A0A9D3Z680_DREPO|nr:hypothetical protein DPMN_070587 [Dreissena polymorpha]
MQGTTRDIECCINSQYNSLVEVNRLILVGIVDTLILCGQQNLAIRGKEEETSNFMGLLDFQAKHNLVLKEHLQNGDPRTKYTSPKFKMN